MTGRTPNYSLSTIANSGDGNLSDDGYKYTNADRQLIDRLLHISMQHHHVGGTNGITTPTDPPELTLSTSDGSLQAGLRIYYKYTLVDENGFESAGSSEATVDTPAQVATPGAPILTNLATTGGSLPSGSYFYVLSAYSGGESTQETRAGAIGNILVPAGTSTNKVRLTFPSLPANATGWNIYMKQPGAVQYFWLASVDMTVATPPSYYDDDGVPAADCARIAPTVNTTLTANSVTVDFPGGPVPVGYTWRIYRTFTLSNYNNSLLHWVVEDTTPTIIDATYIDTGTATLPGSPPTSTQIIENPDPVDLGDGAEVQGRLPLGNMTGFPFAVTFVTQGVLTSNVVGRSLWKNPFPSARIVALDAQLGYTNSQTVPSTVASGSGMAIEVLWATAPTLNLITATDIAAGNIDIASGQSGNQVTGTTFTMGQGDILKVNHDGDSAATPTARDLTITVWMIATFNETISDNTLWD